MESGDRMDPLWPPCRAAGIAAGYDGTAQALAERLLRDRGGEVGTFGGRLRATVVSYDPAGSPSEVLATAEITLPADAPREPDGPAWEQIGADLTEGLPAQVAVRITVKLPAVFNEGPQVQEFFTREAAITSCVTSTACRRAPSAT